MASKRPQDVHFVWEKNGQKIETCVSEQTHVVADGRVHVLTWIKDAVAQDSQYCCLVSSKAGNKMSTLYISVEGSNNQDSWSRDYGSWRSIVSEHDKLMTNWKKAWEGCNMKGIA